MTHIGKAAALLTSAFLAVTIATAAVAESDKPLAQLGPRPFFLVDDMDAGALKDALQAVRESDRSTGPHFSIGHRGAGAAVSRAHPRSPTRRRRAWAPASSNAT